MRNRILSMSLTACLALTLFGCGGGEADQRAAEGNPPKSDVALPGHDLQRVRLQPNGGSYTIVFDIAKTTSYFCSIHGGAPGVGESGTISVSESGQPKSQVVNIVGGQPLPDVSVAVGDTVTFVNMSNTEHILQTAD